jgi:septum formation protein
MTNSPKLILASSSPRRRELLAQIGCNFSPLSVDIDERPFEGESASAFVTRMAAEKSQAGRLKSGQQKAVLGADTIVVLEGEIMGKPVDEQHAAEMLCRLSGRTHEVLSAISLRSNSHQQALSVSHVTFREISEREMHDYWLSGEPKDKAGGYGIQGLGAIFIEHLEGSYSGVMGLPLFETAQLLKQL